MPYRHSLVKLQQFNLFGVGFVVVEEKTKSGKNR